MVRTLLVLLRSYQIVLLPEVETFSVLMFSYLKTRMSSILEGIASNLLLHFLSFCLYFAESQSLWLDLVRRLSKSYFSFLMFLLMGLCV